MKREVHIVTTLNTTLEIIFLDFKGQKKNLQEYTGLFWFMRLTTNKKKTGGLLFLKEILMLKNIWEMYF